MTSWHEAHAYAGERDDPEPPACPECVKLQRQVDECGEEMSEIVLDVPQPHGCPALLRCDPKLPEVVQQLVAACQKANRYLSELAARGIRPRAGVQGLNDFCEVQGELWAAIRGAGAKTLPAREDDE